MGFELTIATRNAPVASTVDDHAPLQYTAIVLNGTLDDAAAHAVAQAIDTICGPAAACIIVEMESVACEDARALETLGVSMMEARSRDVNVQVAAHDRTLHDRLAAIADSRDWLISYAQSEDPGIRIALHLDGPGRRGSTL